MKLWRKKIMTLACATCLTVGMGAVACADTIDLGMDNMQLQIMVLVLLL